jgi:hypothetical protein
MIPEREIWLVAKAMIQRYGNNAEMEAAERADELLEKGDMESAVAWRRCSKADGDRGYARNISQYPALPQSEAPRSSGRTKGARERPMRSHVPHIASRKHRRSRYSRGSR